MKNFQSVPDPWQKLLSDCWPTKVGAAWLGACAGFLFPNSAGQAAAIAALGLVVLDTLTGTVAARLTGEAISSAKFGRAVIKVFSYFAAILAVAIGFRALPGLSNVYEPAASSVTSLIVLTELISIFENLKRMGFPLPSWVCNLLTSKQNEISKGS